MSKALEAAGSYFCPYGSCLHICDKCKISAKSVVHRYLRALAKEGPSEAMLDAWEWSYATGGGASIAWRDMLRAHIAELEMGK